VNAGHTGSDKFGKIALSEPLTNIAQAVIYFILGITTTNSDIGILASIGYTINSGLALFNLLPFGIFDGAKVMHWDKQIRLAAFMTAGLLFLISFI
jgi:Zn-dependent protease